MRHGVDQGGSQLFRLPRGFDLMRKVLCQGSLEANSNQRADSLQDRIRQLFAGGETALYDAIDAGYRHLHEAPRKDMMSAVIVLTDGLDNRSKIKLEALLDRIKGQPGRTNETRIFTIAYGEDPNFEILKRIAEATQAKAEKGTPETIQKVIKDIASFC